MAEQRTMEYENPLCYELQKRFQNRGIHNPGLAGSVESSEAVRRISAGLDPYEGIRENTAVASPSVRPTTPTRAQEQALRDSEKVMIYRVSPDMYQRSRSYEERRLKGFALPDSTVMPGYEEAYAAGAKIRRTAQQFDRDLARLNAKKRSRGVASVPVLGEACDVVKDSARGLAGDISNLWKRITGNLYTSPEKKAKPKKQIPTGAVMLSVVFVVLLMVIIYSFAQVSELKGEMSTLEAKRADLLQQRAELSLSLEKRDDIRVIQDIAMNQLGMVSVDNLESHYITVSTGEEIDLNRESSSLEGGTLMSALQRILGK